LPPVGFLRRLLGGEPTKPEPPAPVDDAEADAAEEAYQRGLLREEQERMTELTRRQLRYSDYAWKPPGQGGDRRADDADKGVDMPPEGT
jgi:hypothetical protein